MLKDVLDFNLDIVFCGTAKGTTSFQKGFYYAGTVFYQTIYRVGFTNKLLLSEDCYKINNFKIGLTDLVLNQYGNGCEINDKSYDIKVFFRENREIPT